MEKITKPFKGFLALILALIFIGFGIYLIAGTTTETGGLSIAGVFGILLIVAAFFILRGLTVIQPNYSVVLTFFGKYIGSIKENGLRFVNPLFTKQKLSLRAQNLESAKLKVNDKMGNPIEIACVIVWYVSDSYKAVFEVANFIQYIQMQSEAAIRHLAVSFPYDNMEDEHATLTLREGGDKVGELLVQELNDRVAPAGITIKEARISHLAYAPEIAGAMLQRQQATAIVAARTKIVEGAVGMVELALEQLSRKKIVDLDEEKKAAMVSNLMVVLCGEKAATPVLNTGTLYQ
ncbi:SPFH domain-containing protein [Chitinophagaceae bacterium LWZ2-11]